MAILKVKVVDAAGSDLAGQAVKVSGIDALQTNAQGMTQFLITDVSMLDIAINGESCWSGDITALAKLETFQQSGLGFVRVGGP